MNKRAEEFVNSKTSELNGLVPDKLTVIKWLTDFASDEVEAINYTHCSLQLKDKYNENFAYFVEKKVNARKVEDVYYYDGKLFLCADDLFKEYQKITNPLIV
tara:strand:+ start:245 stop:550 length:306 start_codon:yes stop_codon:yes gene_type:complete